MMKRCAIKSITRDKEYSITKRTPKSKILYMSVNPNGEAEVLKVMFKQRTRLKKASVDLDVSKLAIRGRQSQGNLFSRYAIHKILVKERGASTLAGQNIWFDEDIMKLNADGRGRLLGEFEGDDKIIVFTGKEYYTTGYDLTHHFPEDTIRVEKYEPGKVYSVAYYDGGSRLYYLKRFTAEQSDNKVQCYVDEESPKSKLVALNDDHYPGLEVVYGGAHKMRPTDIIDVEQFIGVKSHRAKGKRVTTYEVAKLRFVDPVRPNPEPGPMPEGPDNADMVIPDTLADGIAAGEVTDDGAESKLVEKGAVKPQAAKAQAKVMVSDDLIVEDDDEEQVIDIQQLDLF